MLAPRKKLWSTPSCAIQIATQFANLTSNDILYDVGCGDGRVLIQMASETPCQTLIGIEIDAERAMEAKENIAQAMKSGQIPSDTSIKVVCQNALEVDYSDATVVFLYLIPRGLRLIKSVLLRGRCPTEETTNTLLPPLCVITYMAPFADEQYERKEICVVDHQKGAEWPIYLYTLGGEGKEATKKSNENGSSQGL
mmetsp:Transcript_28294/g.41062  ORF Transcript_28294/g.41062 Transcript_28294/m.41062 type:complete len:196 (+) Transcript_28294:94-681(+)